MRNTIITISVILTIAVMSYGGYLLKRTINYNWYYKDAVKETIREEIKPLQNRVLRLELEVSNLKTNR
jgi:hypothetical protein